jgi:hypothetical protein
MSGGESPCLGAACSEAQVAKARNGAVVTPGRLPAMVADIALEPVARPADSLPATAAMAAIPAIAADGLRKHRPAADRNAARRAVQTAVVAHVALEPGTTVVPHDSDDRVVA